MSEATIESLLQQFDDATNLAAAAKQAAADKEDQRGRVMMRLANAVFSLVRDGKIDNPDAPNPPKMVLFRVGRREFKAGPGVIEEIKAPAPEVSKEVGRYDE